MKGSEAYCILGFRVPTTSVGARGEGEQGEGMLYCFKVPTTSVRQGARGSEGKVCCTVLRSPPHLWGKERGGESKLY